MPWLPSTCAYRRRAEGEPLPDWHYLISGDRDAMHPRRRLASPARWSARPIAGPLEHHIVEWERRMIDWLRRGARRGRRASTVGDRELPLVDPPPPRATRLTMRLAPDGSEVRVSLPRWGRTLDALVFAATAPTGSKASSPRCPRRRRPRPAARSPIAANGCAIEHGTRGSRASPALADGALRLGGPEPRPCPRACAAGSKPKRCALLGEDLARLLRARRPCRSPSCALSRAQPPLGQLLGATAAIRINWRLVQAPDLVRRSVVAHEVAHLVHFDHSPGLPRAARGPVRRRPRRGRPLAEARGPRALRRVRLIH